MQQKKLSILFLTVSIFIVNQALAKLPEALTKKYPSTHIKENQIQLRAPEVAEEGKVVPITIRSVKLPSNDVYITDVSFYSENNTNCPLSQYKLTANMLGDGLGTRVKLPKTTRVHAIARLSNGDVISGSQEIKVTIGGCGGGSIMPNNSSAGNYCLKNNRSIQ